MDVDGGSWRVNSAVRTSKLLLQLVAECSICGNALLQLNSQGANFVQ